MKTIAVSLELSSGGIAVRGAKWQMLIPPSRARARVQLRATQTAAHNNIFMLVSVSRRLFGSKYSEQQNHSNVIVSAVGAATENRERERNNPKFQHNYFQRFLDFLKFFNFCEN